MLLPEPVGATDRTSRPASIAATTSDCPGLNASSPKTSLSVRSALSIIPPECDGISRRDRRLLTWPQVESGHCRSWIELTGGQPGEKANGQIHVRRPCCSASPRGFEAASHNSEHDVELTRD